MTPTPRVALVTDSTVSLPPSLAEALGLRIVPMHIAANGRSYRDGVDITPGDLYRALRRGASPPSTGSPDPGSFLSAFRDAAAQGQDVLCVTVARRYSSVFDSASAAAELFREEGGSAGVAVVDSGVAAGAQAALVVALARRVLAEGLDLPVAEALLDRFKGRCAMLAALDTLAFVARGGHAPRVAAWAGDLLKVKPILEMAPGGEIHRLERPRTRHRALDRLIVLARERIGDRPVLLNVIHADAADEAALLRQRAEAAFACTEVLVTEFSSVIGAHTGPGLLGLAYCLDPNG